VSLHHHRLTALPGPEQPEARNAALLAAVEGFAAEFSIDTDRTYVTLPRGVALLSRLTLPAAAKSDLHQVIEFELDRLVPLSREEIYYDALVRDSGSKLDVLVISVPRRVVSETIAVLDRAGRRARSIVITPIALLDFLRFCPDGDTDNVVVLLDDGGTTEFDYFTKGVLAASHLVRPDEVASDAAVARLVSRETLSVGSPGGPVKVYAWRSDEGLDGTSSHLPPELRASGPEILRRAQGALVVPDRFFETASPAIVPAIGAALAAVREGTADLNLLPLEERRSVEEGAPLVTFFCAAVLVVVTLVWLVSAMVKDYRVAGTLQDEISSLEPTMREVHRNEENAGELRKKLRVLMQDDRRRISVLLRELTEVVPQDAYLTTFRVRTGKIELEGFARSASDLVPLLEKSPFFKNAQFTSPVTKVQNNQERFSLTTEIEE
jgi:general secretion pathway protein L